MILCNSKEVLVRQGCSSLFQKASCFNKNVCVQLYVEYRLDVSEVVMQACVIEKDLIINSNKNIYKTETKNYFKVLEVLTVINSNKFYNL